MKNFFFYLSILLTLTNCSNQSEKDKKLLEERILRLENGLQPNLQIHKDSIQEIQHFNIEDRMKELGVNGLSIAVINNGVIEWAKGYGVTDTTENRKVTTETMFLAGSISKPVAATRALQLYENGALDLDANVNDYLVNWKLPDNEFTLEEKVTTRRILDHSAGLTVWGFPGYERGEDIPSTPEILDGKGNTDSVRVYKKPGESWRYSGGGYTIMQQMIADIEERQFHDVMQEHVLDPLGMTKSTYENPLPEKYHDLAATGYYTDGSQVNGKWHVYPEMAAAGLWTTPSQLVIWAKEIMEVYQSQEDGLIKAKTANEMLTLSTDNYGLGIVVEDHTFVHSGADAGFRAQLVGWKDHPVAYVIMVNSENSGAIFREVLLSIVKEYELPGVEPRTRIIREQTTDKLKQFEGTYDFPERGVATLSVNENGDGLQFTGGPFEDRIIHLLPEEDFKFFNKNSGVYYTFRHNGDEITGVEFSILEGKRVK
ncbi:serine hydrolase [Leptobacterium flavescens]|uniref:Serine hydrolase n=1 Tax=Leptobacterium flavescens TaxID=472055 RepID=A0A6P0USM6_9FLAO|nr:serine hydrolase [Leptobacterium flavescens]NER14988.1 serine hydrolase [Leptobacterium flavescens]